MKISKCYFDVLGHLVIKIRCESGDSKQVFNTPLTVSPKQIATVLGYNEELVKRALLKLIREGVIFVKNAEQNTLVILLKNFYN